ncbi:spermatogenesis-associated serine-rich protein 2-like isoform X2 [Ostrea edulis]|uniref:spermatogenesis-associated serine-rich protein 2-like isoform X2 n=1 Tax=Ostrea edulis TaxID=37623 RepID=UPI0024AF5B76|nr:spermatogenesis-associated serine-rich protein 2-like isoform X2 [Ostrea edulis]
MARKNENSGTIHFDTRTKAVMAEVSLAQENIKEKVNAVREVILGKSNNEIILVLQYYEYDVAKAIQAYCEDGAKKALTEWHWSGNKTPNKKKKNKKKASSVTASEDGESQSPKKETSISSHLTNGIAIKDNIPNGVIVNETESSKLCNRDTEPTGVEQASVPGVQAASGMSPNSNNNAEPANSSPSKRQSPQPQRQQPSSRNSPPASSSQSHKPTSTPQPQRLPHSHPHSRQRTQSGSHSHRQRTVSEKSNASQSEHKPTHYKAHAGLEKSVKDLHRQTVALERFRMILNEEVDKTYKRIKTVFDEMRTSLNSREADLTSEMDQVKLSANDIFAMRQKRAIELKTKVDRSDNMNEQELSELRSEIKHFIGERKIDEDLSRTTRFLYDSDHLKEEICQFGEVVPVKCSYSARRPSISSVASSGPEEVDSLASSLNNPAPVVDSGHEMGQENIGASEAHEMAELQRRLKGSLQIQGYMKVEGQRSDQTHSPTKSSPTSNSGHISNESSRSTHASQKKTVIEESANKQANPSETSSVREKSSENGLVKSGLESEAARRSQYSGRGRGRGGGYRGRPRKDGGEFYYRNQGGYERGGYRRRGDYQNSRRDNDGRNYRPRDDYPKSAPQRGERQSNSRNERQNTAGVNERPRTAREGVKESRGGKDSNDKPQE